MWSFEASVRCSVAMLSVRVMILVLMFADFTSKSLAADLCKCGLQLHEQLDQPSAFSIVTRVIGGKKAVEGEFPWAALIYVKHIKNRKRLTQRCGGSLINDRFVLTAAHCLDANSVRDVEVVLGTTDRNGRRRKYKRKYIHPNYKEDPFRGSIVFDVALIELEDPIDWSEEPGIRPICLPDNTFVNFTQQARALVTGWGATRIEYEERMFYTRGNDVEGSLADTLNKLEDLSLLSQSECINSYNKFEGSITIEDSNICALSPTGDSCLGDSGSGLVHYNEFDDPMKHELVGVVSFGVGCDSSISESGEKLPGIYSRVSPSVDWIKEMSSSGEFCAEPSLILPRVIVETEEPIDEERSTKEPIDEDWSSEDPIHECGTLLKRYPDISHNYLKCRKKKRNRDSEWINSHLDLCTRVTRGYERFRKFKCVDLWCEEMRNNIEGLKEDFSKNCQTHSRGTSRCQDWGKIIRTYNFSQC